MCPIQQSRSPAPVACLFQERDCAPQTVETGRQLILKGAPAEISAPRNSGMINISFGEDCNDRPGRVYRRRRLWRRFPPWCMGIVIYARQRKRHTS